MASYNLALEIPFYFCQSSQSQQVIEIGPAQVNGTEKRFHPSMEGEVTLLEQRHREEGIVVAIFAIW